MVWVHFFQFKIKIPGQLGCKSSWMHWGENKKGRKPHILVKPAGDHLYIREAAIWHREKLQRTSKEGHCARKSILRFWTASERNRKEEKREIKPVSRFRKGGQTCETLMTDDGLCWGQERWERKIHNLITKLIFPLISLAWFKVNLPSYWLSLIHLFQNSFLGYEINNIPLRSRQQNEVWFHKCSLWRTNDSTGLSYRA